MQDVHPNVIAPRILPSVLGLLVVILLGPVSHVRAATRPPSPGGWKTYVDPAGFFTCSFPQDWKNQGPSDAPRPFYQDTILSDVFYAPKDIYDWMWIELTYDTGGLSPQDYYADVTEEWPASKLIAENWNGETAYEFALTRTETHPPLEGEAATVTSDVDVVLIPVAGGGLLVAHLETDPSNSAESKPIFRQVLGGLRTRLHGSAAIPGAPEAPQFPQMH